MESVNRLWNPDGGAAEWLRLIDFINPGSKVIKEVLAQAKAKAPNGEFPAYEPPDGWSRTIEDLVNLQVEAIYETLRARGIGYTVERWDSKPPAQIIRTHEEILDSGGIGGPCIDLVVLMAACLEAVGIQPLVVVLEEEQERKRHAVLGYRIKEHLYGPETSANKTPHLFINGKQEFGLLSKQELDRLKNTGEVEFVNCTGITRGENVGFKEAQNQGKGYVESSEPAKRNRYQDHWQVIFALDVKVARHTVLTREMEDYLQRLQADALTLPSAFGFPPGASFPKIRVRVKVRKEPRRFSEAEAREWEAVRREGYVDEKSTTRVYQYPHPWPEEGEREAERPMDWDREVRGRLKRAVILGDPGFGKTWLLKHEALQLAEEALKKLKEYPLATDEIKLPIFLPLAQLAQQTDGRGQPLAIEEALIPASWQRYPIGKELKKWIEKNLKSEQVVLLLDALDEVTPQQKEALCKRLDDFARKYDQTKILLTSRFVGYPGKPFPLPPDGELELLPFDRRQQEEFARVWFAVRPGRGDFFLQKLRESPQLYTLAGVPLLLALMCRLFDERDELPRSRAELYEACIWGILTQKWKTPRSEDDPYHYAKLQLIAEVAHRLFVAEKELFYLDDLLDLVGEIFREQPQLKENLGNKSSADLIGELQRDGLLIKAGAGVNPPFLFLHLTFQEYLAACALVRRKELVKPDGEKIPEWLALVKPHLFDPRWEEVIRLLASKLEDATPLIQAIWQEPEDLFLGRTLLAGKCLAGARCVKGELHKTITSELLTLMKNPVRLKAKVPVSLRTLAEERDKLERVVGSLASTYDDIFQKLASLLQDRDWCRTLVIGAFGASNDPKAESYLIELLEDSDPDIRGQAAVVLAQMRSEQVVPRLGMLFKDSHPDVRAAAAWALAQIGDYKAVPRLIELLNDSDPRVRAQAAEALGWLGVMGAATHLIQLLKDSAALVRGAAAIALGRLQIKGAVPGLFEMIAKGTGPSVAAAWALTQLVDIDDLVHRLIKLLEDSELSVKCEAAAALGFIGRPEAAPHLLQFIKNPPWGGQVLLTRRISPTASFSVLNGPPLEVLSPLLDLIEVAAWALGTIDSEEAVPHLMRLLKHSASGLRGAAAWALGNMNRKEAIPYLIQLLKDPDLRVRGVAAKALGGIGSEEAIPHLLRLVRQPTTPWYAGFGIFWGLLRWRRGSEGVIAFGEDLDQKERNRVEALCALRTISQKQGIRIFPDGSYVKVR